MNLILSLFPNIGMLDAAFEEEWSAACIVRGPDPIFNALSDVRQFCPPSGKFDGVIGGPPCQSFSSLSHLVRRNGNEPRFGNLIPEFERCVAEARPEWFLMENVWQAPLPAVEGYGVTAFLLANETLDAGDGYGLEQMRTRRFSFGLRGRQAPDLRRWIQFAALKLLKASPTVTQCAVNQSREAKGRVLKSAVIGHGGAMPQQRRPQRFLKHAVVGHSNAGLGRLAASTQRVRKNAVVSGHGKSLEPTASGGGSRGTRSRRCAAFRGSRRTS